MAFILFKHVLEGLLMTAIILSFLFEGLPLHCFFSAGGMLLPFAVLVTDLLSPRLPPPSLAGIRFD